MRFKDRISAGLELAERLAAYATRPALVLGVPRGGVPVAYAIAQELHLPMDLVLTKKVGHPLNREYAIGAVSLTDSVMIPHEEVPQEYIRKETEAVRQRLRDMYRKFRGEKEPPSLKGKTVIVVDDGVATGNTLMATVQMLRKQEPEKLIIAVPVASADAVRKLRPLADELVCLYVPEVFYGVGAFFEDFGQVPDEDVAYYLRQIDQNAKKQRV